MNTDGIELSLDKSNGFRVSKTNFSNNLKHFS